MHVHAVHVRINTLDSIYTIYSIGAQIVGQSFFHPFIRHMTTLILLLPSLCHIQAHANKRTIYTELNNIHRVHHLRLITTHTLQ